MWNYVRYAQQEGAPTLHDLEWVFEDVVENGTDVCVIYEEDEEFDLAKGIACDCSEAENFDFEDEGKFFDSLTVAWFFWLFFGRVRLAAYATQKNFIAPKDSP